MSVRDLIKYSAVPALIVDRYDLKIIHANDKAAVLTQWSKRELTRKFLSEMLSPISGDPGNYDDIILLTKDGNKLQVHVNIQAVVEYNFLLVSFWKTDSGERTQMENEINAWRQAFEEHGSPVTIHSPNYDLLDANHAACDAFGMTKEQLKGRKCYELFHGKDEPTIGCPLKTLIESGHHTSEVVEIETLHENAVVDCSPVFDKNGKLEKIIHTAIDVKSIVRMRKELAKKKIILDQEEQYRAITQSASDAIITIDTQDKIAGWNPGAQKIFGYTEKEMIGREITLIIPKKYVESHLKGLERLMGIGEHRMIGKTVEIEAAHKSGVVFPVELSLSEWEINSGKYFTAIIRDISSRKIHEKELEEEQNFTEAVLESLPGIFYLFSYPELRLERWNKNHETLLGFSSKELKNRFVTEWFLPEAKKNVLNIMDEVIEKGYIRMDQIIIAKDGRLIPCILTGVRIKIKGKLYIMGVGTDISLRKRTENKLSKSEAQLRSLLNTIPDLVWLKDSNGVYLACNESFERYMDISKDEIIGKTDFELVDSERAKVFQMKDNEAITAGKSIFSEEWITLDKDGPRAFVETVKTPMFDFEGKFMGVLGIGHDMTERKKAEAEIHFKNEELLKINAEKDKFFSIVAHDLRSPFNSFLGLTRIMAEELPKLKADEIHEIALNMRKSASNLFQLLENLLSWANMKQGLIHFNPEKISLLSLVDDVIQQSISESARVKNIQVSYDVLPEINVFADRNMAQSIIRNLLSNALKFTHKGGRISLSAIKAENGFVEMRIVDTGMGMGKDVLGNLFILNAKINRIGTDGEPSTGLGLLLCEEFVTKQGGKIWAESKEGKGSVFHFTLPLKAPSKS